MLIWMAVVFGVPAATLSPRMVGTANGTFPPREGVLAPSRCGSLLALAAGLLTVSTVSASGWRNRRQVSGERSSTE